LNASFRVSGECRKRTRRASERARQSAGWMVMEAVESS
jgi:predicted DNA-binding protein